MTDLDNPIMQQLERYLDLTVFREGIVAGNIANLDTPGYRTRDMDFRSAFAAAVEGDGSGYSTPEAEEVPGLIQRPDGNNVSLERESMLLAETQLQFHAGEELLRSHFQRLLFAINEGKSS